MLLIDIARLIQPIVENAVKALGPDLQGNSIIDLCCDNLPSNISISDIKAALVVAGIDSLVSARLRKSYSYR